MVLNKTILSTAVIASTSAASFIIGTHFSKNFDSNERSNKFPHLFLPFRKAEALVATLQPDVSTLPNPQFEQQSKGSAAMVVTGSDANIHLDDMEIWKRPSRAAEIMKFGYPGFDNLRTYEDFVLSYDRRTRTAHWVVEHLSPDRMTYDASVDRSKCMFRPDSSIHPFFQSQNTDYFRSGYDRGHLAAAGNHRKTQQSIDQTFFLTNMSPQVGKGFNRDKWNDLEKHCRRKARVHPNVYICTGPLYLAHQEDDGSLYVKYKVIGQNRVAVPTHFFKVLLFETKEGTYELESYLLPNAAVPDEKPISDFLVPIDTIERPAGFLIFERMPRHNLAKINGKSVTTERKRGGLFGLLFGTKPKLQEEKAMAA